MGNQDVDEIEVNVCQWYPHDLLRRTNWLHRVDALRIHDIREMRLL